MSKFLSNFASQNCIFRINMKNLFPIYVCAMLFASCQSSKEDVVNDLLKAGSCFNKEKVSQLITDDFMYYGTDTLNKEGYLARIDFWKSIDCQGEILNIQGLDSVVRTEEQSRNIAELMLDVNPLIVQKRTYRFAGEKIKSITVDSILNYEEYQRALNEKWVPFVFYLFDKYSIEDWTKVTPDLKKYLSEYTALSTSEKKQYKNYAFLQGTYESKDCVFYKKLIFRGKKTVTIIDAFFGFPVSTSYELDEDIVKVTDRSDLLFVIKDSQTLIGEGFASGTFTKIN